MQSFRLLGQGAWLALALAATPIAAQAPVARPVTFWFNAGYGRGWVEGFSTAEEAFSLSSSVQWRWLLVSGRLAAVSPSLFDTVFDYGLLAGGATPPGRSWHAGAAVGFGGVEAQDGTHAVSVPLEAQVFWRFSRNVGLGLYGFGSLNRKANLGGVTLALQVGRLR